MLKMIQHIQILHSKSNNIALSRIFLKNKESKNWTCLTKIGLIGLHYLNYYLSFDVCACFRLSECLNVCLSAKNFLSKMDQICKFGEQTSRILEFKPEGLEG